MFIAILEFNLIVLSVLKGIAIVQSHMCLSVCLIVSHTPLSTMLSASLITKRLRVLVLRVGGGQVAATM
jgi:hypothetical protein